MQWKRMIGRANKHTWVIGYLLRKHMKKCIKTHGKSLQKRIDLKTEDADRWQKSLQQQFIMVVAATNTRPEHPSFETAVDAISDLLKIRCVYVRVGWQRRHIVVVAGTYTQSFWLLTGGATVKFSFYVKKMKSTASVGTEATFFRTPVLGSFVVNRNAFLWSVNALS